MLARDIEVLYALKSNFFVRKDLSMSNVKAVKRSFVELPGVRLYYEISGDGDPVVFLHGGLLDGGMWDNQFQFFSQHYQAIRYDMRWAGKSETIPSTEPYAPYQDLHPSCSS
jgi:3-oxoadipate enol-lactonase